MYEWIVHLHAAFVPPRPALEELERALDPALARHSAQRAAAADMHLPVAGFGNVTTGDGRRVVAALTAAAPQWPQPRLIFAGAEVLETSAGWSVWATVDGDVDGLRQIAQAVTRCVERIGFYVDRRRFHAGVEIARATTAASTADLDGLVGLLDTFAGQPWCVDHLAIFTTVISGERVEYREVDRVAFGAAG